MEKWNGQHRRNEEPFVRVKDERSEFVSILNTVFTSLILMVMSWVGYNINRITDRLGELTTASELAKSNLSYMSREINRIDTEFDKHKTNVSAHHRPYKYRKRELGED